MQTEDVKVKFAKEDLILETGELAKQANGSVLVRYGGTVVLVSVCCSKQPREGIDFLPLFVEYQEKTYAAGRIPGGFFKREGRPSENEILISRLIDRPLRPLFDKNIRNEIQIVAVVLSSDGSNDPDILSVIGASCAVSISGIPFAGPVGACRVGFIESDFVLNPTYEELEKSSLNLVVAASREGIIMLEADAKEETDETVFAAIEFALSHIPKVIDLQEELIKKVKKPALELALSKAYKDLLSGIDDAFKERIKKSALIANKDEYEKCTKEIVEELVEKLSTDTEKPEVSGVKDAVAEMQEQGLRNFILKEHKRVDGREFDEVRPITCRVSNLPRTHGSSIFTRGQTQSLAVTTLGTRSDEQMIEALEGKTYESFLLHYSFPPFSVGEVKPMRGPGRREIGHGALARKALAVVMPEKDDFPYTVRVVSEILESNGSSSMATVCAATLSLMDAGVPIKSPVAGVALGLVKEGKTQAILTDISGGEDHFGDMDFKIAGTKNGITALQLDLKIDGVDLALIKDAMEQSRKARTLILDKISQTLDAPRKEISDYAPRIKILQINTEKIGDLIGPGGKVIKKIINSTGVTIDIDDDGRVLIGSDKKENLQAALDTIRMIVEDVEVGKVYAGKVVKITNFGAFCEIAPGKEGLVHVSEISDSYVKNVSDVLKVNDEVKVKVIAIDELGRINLSLKKAKDDK
ncbi:MAG: polyribonucleotide nucleotidyltransferase [Candidatus Omnitrophica bacterium]|nr:polyribonucleotide nucleotidyltransferase [Candidatus Omnitrophota bacterium]